MKVIAGGAGAADLFPVVLCWEINKRWEIGREMIMEKDAANLIYYFELKLSN